ncbi:unnamed protein product [Caenorhabditis nigoni]
MLMAQIMDDDAIKQIAVCRMCLRSKDLPAAAQNRFAQNSSNAKIVRTSRAHIFQVDDLIIRTEDEGDGHLLTQDLVEEQQPVQNVHQQNDSEEIFNRRDFDSNDDQVQKSMTSAYAKIRCSR